MSITAAKATLDRQVGDPATEWLSTSRVKTTLDHVYNDMGAQLIRPPIVGVNLSPWPAPLGEQVAEVAALNPNLVCLPIRVEGDQDDAPRGYHTSTNRADVVSADLTLAEAQVAALTGRDIMVEIYPWVNGGNSSEIIWSPPDPATFFANYAASVTTIMVAMEAANVSPWGINIGANLTEIEGYTAGWSVVIDAVRAIFPSCRVVYRTNHWITAPGPYAVSPAEEVALEAAFTAVVENPIWNLVDYVSIAAYFELTDESNPSTEAVIEALHYSTFGSRLQPIVAEVERLATYTGKPILFGELACGHWNQALKQPWDPTDAYTSGTNWNIQRRMIEAYIRVFGQYDWWAGFSLYGIGHIWENGYDLKPSAIRLMASL